MKKAAAVLTAFVVALSAMAATALAYEDEDQTHKLVIEAPVPADCGIDPEYDPSTMLLQSEPDFYGAEKALHDGILNFQDEVDITSFKIKKSDFQKLFDDLWYCYGDIASWLEEKVNITYSYSAEGPEGIVTECFIEYSIDKEDYERDKAVYASYVNDIVSKADPGFSDLEKLLFIHDYLTSNYEYDTGLEIHHSFEFFENKKGVCQAYTEAFCTLMRKMGIRTSYVHSTKMDHVWNLVELDGKWYQIDVTHDDPVPDYTGNSMHREFLITDQKMKKIKFDEDERYDIDRDYDWVYGVDVKCDDDTYENGFWSDARSPFIYIPETEKWYFFGIPRYGTQIGERGLYIWNGDNNIELVDCGYNDLYSIGSALVRHKGKLYFNNTKDIYSYDLRTGKLAVAMPSEYLTSLTTDMLNGFKISEDDKLEYSVYHVEKDPNNPSKGTPSTKTANYEAFSPYYDVDGIYGYYWDFDKLQVKAKQPGTYIITAWYDENGKQLKADIFDSGEGTSEGSKGLKAKIMVADENYKPLCPAELEA